MLADASFIPRGLVAIAGTTTLMLACKYGKHAFLPVLLQHKANVNLFDRNRKSQQALTS